MSKGQKKTNSISFDKHLVVRLIALFTVLLLPFGLYASLQGDRPVLAMIAFCLIIVGMFLGAWF